MLLYTVVQLHLLSSGAQKPLLAGALPAAVPDAGRGRTDLSWLWALMLWLTVQRHEGLCLRGAGAQAGAEVSSEVSSEAPQAGVQVTTCLIMCVQVAVSSLAR